MATRETTIKLSVSDNFSQQLRNFASAIDKADTETKQLAKSTQDAAKGSSQLASGLGQIAGGLGLSLGIAGVTAAVVGLGKQSIELGMKMEQTKIAFANMTGSADNAKAHLEELAAFAAKTPFQFDDVVTASRRLHAFGFETQQIIPMLVDIGDAAAAMGASADTINRITLAIGQMSSKGKVSAQEMLQLTEAGIPAWKYLAQSVGVTTAEVQKMTEKGLVPADAAIQALLKGMREDFGGQMAEQAKTAGGAWSNLNDTFNQFLTMVGEKANPALNVLFNGLSDNFAFMTLMTKAMEEGTLSAEDFFEIWQAGISGGSGAALDLLNEKLEETAEQSQQATDDMMKLLNLLNGGTEQVYEFGTAAEDVGTNWQAVFSSMFNAGELTLAQYMELFDILESGAADSEKQIGKLLESINDGKIKAALDDIRLMVQGPVGDENSSFIDKQAELRLEIQATKDELQKYYDMQGKTITVTEEATVSTAEYALAQFNAGESGWKLAEAQRLLSENTDPDKQIQLEGAVLRAQVALEKANEKVGEYGTKMGTSSEVTLDFSGKIGELEENLGTLNGAFDANAAAHEESTKRILFGILQQRLAMDGWTSEELEFLTEAGEQWGIFDKETATALRNADKALELFSQGHGNEALVLLNAIYGFPDTKTYRINVEVGGAAAGEVGIGPTAPLPTTPGSGGGSTTTGGTVGQQALGGEYMVSRPTTFTAGEAGPEKVKIEKAGSGGGNNKGGVTQYNTFNINSPMDMEMVLSQLAVRAKENLN